MSRPSRPEHLAEGFERGHVIGTRQHGRLKQRQSQGRGGFPTPAAQRDASISLGRNAHLLAHQSAVEINYRRVQTID